MNHRRIVLDLREQLQRALGSAYTIELELGGGGMSRIFVALDASLQRRVVVKILPPDFAASVSMERFKREIMLAARLQHPHIVPLLSAGEMDGIPYLTMPFVDGESLRARLERSGELPISDGVRLLREVASALAYAHDEGIVHRDVKPDNILLSRGSAMVTDFGVAKAISSSTYSEHTGVTSSGVALGTPAYMSPEQAAAAPNTDARADIYAFGVVAYELFAGRPPFSGRSSQALLAAHVTETPQAIQAVRPSLPAGLAALIMRCLEKRPADRPQDASEIVRALDAITASGDLTPTTGSQPARTGAWHLMRRPMAALTIVLAAAAVIAAAVVLARRPAATPVSRTAAVTSVAVLPFAVGGDSASEYFADGLTEELINVLAGVSSVRVAPRSAVFAFKGKDLSDLQSIGKRLGASLLVEGTVRRTASLIKVSAELIDANAGTVIASRSLERPASDVFALEDSVARDLVGALEGRLGVPLTGATLHPGTSNQEAYDDFLKGEYFANRFTENDLHRAIDLYQQAIRLDTSFARPWAGIASAWDILADTWLPPAQSYPQAEIAARHALALDPSLAQARANLGMVLAFYHRDYRAAYEELTKGVALDSSCSGCHAGLGFLFADFGMRDSALIHAGKLVELDSLSALNLSGAQQVRILVRDVDGAIGIVDRKLRLGAIDSADRLGDLAELYWRSGRRAQADSVIEVACGSRTPAQWCAVVPAPLLVRGDTAGARASLAAMEQRLRAAHHYPNPVTVAAFHLAMSDTAAALAALERALVERTATLTEVAQDPSFDGLHSYPQFKSIVHRAGLDTPLLRSPR